MARHLTLFAVLALHAAVFYWLAISLGQRRVPVTAAAVPMEAIMLPELIDEPSPTQATGAARRSNPRSEPKEPVADVERTTSPAPSTAITDWYAEAGRAAEDVLENARRLEGLRSFTHKSVPEAELEKPGVFGSEQRNRRAGMSDGPDRVWVTDNCYFEWDRSAPKPEYGPKLQLHKPTCKPPPTGGGDHLFDELRPEYLKRLPEAAGQK